MGNSNSIITEELLEEYLQLTYLSKSEIYNLLKKFCALLPDKDSSVFMYRIHVEKIMLLFPQVKCNPFKDRICSVFSSGKDDFFSFEDVLDLCSVMSEKCPNHVKALWAFRIFDFNDDRAIDKDDLMEIIDRLTRDPKSEGINTNDKNRIIDILLNSMDIEHNGCIGPLEFEHAIGKMSDFSNAFTFRV